MTHPIEVIAGGEDRLRAFNYLVPTVVEQTNRDAVDQQQGTPQRIARPVDPRDGGDENKDGTDLRDAEHKNDRREHRRIRDARYGEAKAGGGRLDDRGDNHSERHCTNGLTGKYDRVFAAVGGETAAEASHAVRCGLSVGVEDRRDHQRQDEVQDHEAETARLSSKP